MKNEYLEIPPTEDLMKEHGLLNRVLLIYEEIVKVQETNNTLNIDILGQALSIIINFIENYHEKMEENYIFPIFEKARKKITLIKILKKQHTKGRLVSKKISSIIKNYNNSIKQQKELVILLKKFIKMYRPHEAREDTELFPLVRTLLNEKHFKELGEILDKTEDDLFGKGGFNKLIKQVEGLEKRTRHISARQVYASYIAIYLTNKILIQPKGVASLILGPFFLKNEYFDDWH